MRPVRRSYDDDPLDGRDDDGPIFPIGDVDERLGVHAAVLGVVLDDGTPVAFSVDELVGTLANDTDTIEFAGVTVRRDGSGFAASANGTELGSHESFWFAWSQFHPGTALWPNDA